MLDNESKTTAKVLAAVPEGGRTFKPDAKSRTAWDLATHVALGDIWFLDSIINGKFEMEPDGESQAAKAFKSVKDVVDFCNREFPARLKQLRALPADKPTRMVDFLACSRRVRRCWVSPTTTASITADSSPRTSVPPVARCRRSTAAAPTSR